MKRKPIYLFFLLSAILSFYRVSAAPVEVRTGVYLMNMYDLNMDEHSFYADFYVWFKWKGELDPTNIEFVNAVEKWGMTLTPFGDTAAVMKDGTFYKIFRVEGRFFHSFSLNRFPLDRHQLDIQIENPEYPADTLIYIPDTNGAIIRKTLNLVGWEQQECYLDSRIHDYESDFGNPEESADKYSNLTFYVTLARPYTYFLLKMLLPLLVVVLVSIGALLLHPSYLDARYSLPIGGLLTAVFLQQSYDSALPDTGYMVLMDKIYLLCYILISLILLQVIRAGNRLIVVHEAEVHRIDKKEQRLALFYFLAVCLGILLICLF